jgi:lipopolysaccharide transport system ATP-binding protein
MKPIIEVSHISKKFRIEHLSGGYISLRERIMQRLSFKAMKSEDFWALHDVSFNVTAGECLGIIGRNGAGKSTLLKILSRITPPTRGKIIARGRIASLLEVGTGFHPELTGRENIFFNGALLGMRRQEIRMKFDEIVDFSGTGNFLDTAIKHYSNGMQLRLAFAVAAFLEPEILIIDEVLSVGDAEFQRKCLGKMEDVTKRGRTVLFVSHQLGAVSQLCQRALLLDKGRIMAEGSANEIINDYTSLSNAPNDYESLSDESRVYQIASVRSLNFKGDRCIGFAHDEPVLVETNVVCRRPLRQVNLMVSVNNKHGQRIFSAELRLDDHLRKAGESMTATLSIPRATLTPGNYTFFVSVHHPNAAVLDMGDRICPISVYDNGSAFAQYENKLFYGDVFVDTNWQVRH